jgi:hypothetical protein
MTKRSPTILWLAAMASLQFLGPVRADSIDDADAKRRGVPVAQVQAENALAREKQKTAELEKQIAELNKQLVEAQGNSGKNTSAPQALAPDAARQKAVKEPWMSKPTAQWPQIHLTNDVKLTGNRTMNGASCSLIKLDDGRLFGVTARHLMGPDGGIDPALKLSEIDTNVQSWMVRTYASPQPQVRFAKLATRLDDEGKHDCLIFTVTGDLTHLPGLALKPRLDPLQPGDKVYLLGCPYTQTPYHQNAYPGTVTKLNPTGVADFHLDADLVTRGFSGAPVIDDSGHFAGVFSGHFNDSGTASGGYHDVYMVSASAVLDLIPKK